MIILFLLIFGLVDAKLPLYIFYTPSHEIFVKQWFLPTLPEDFDLREYRVEQKSATGAFYSAGWKETTEEKLRMCLTAIDTHWGELFLYSDVDIQFFRPITEELLTLAEGKDLLIQRSNPEGWCCTGFFLVRANETTRALFQIALEMMEANVQQDDESALNVALQHVPKLQWDYLPPTYFCGGTFTGRQWIPGKKLPIPINMALHHANYTVGIPNKLKQLRYVRQHHTRLEVKRNLFRR